MNAVFADTLTDCTSFDVMEELDLREGLTSDRHRKPITHAQRSGKALRVGW